MQKLLGLFLLISSLGIAQTRTFPAQETNNSFTGTNLFSGVTTFGAQVNVNTGLVICWNSDTGISRSAAVTLNIGTCANGNASGTLKLATLTASAGVTAGSFNTVLWVGSTQYPTLASCYAAIPAGGGVCMVPPNYTETLAADVAMTKSNSGFQFTGPANITMGAFRFTSPSGVNNLFITSPYSHSSNQAGSNLGVSFQNYTGAAGVIDLGDSSGFIFHVKISGINMGMDAGAQANSSGIQLTNVVESDLNDNSCVQGTVAGQRCVHLVGTGAFFTGLLRIMGQECNSGVTATNNFCIQSDTITNAVQVLGGHGNMGGNANGSVCLDVKGATSTGMFVFGFDCDVAQTAVTVESTQNTAIWGFVRVDSSVANTANFGAGSFGNMIWTNANLPYTDSGTSGTNSIINPQRFNWRSDVWQMAQSAGSMLWNDRADASSRLIFAQGAAGDTRLSGGSGAGAVKLAWDQGTGGVTFGNGAGVAASVVDSTGVFHPQVAGAIDLGTTLLPFSGIRIGAAATNNIRVTGTATGARVATLPDNTGTIAELNLAQPWTAIQNLQSNTVALTADWTCGTAGTVASCTAATIIGSGGGVPLTFTLPLVAQSYTWECDLVVGQATAATLNQWNMITATNGATNVTANYTMATAATAFTGGATTDQGSTTTTFQIGPSWTLGGTATKMPVHIWGRIEGASASGTVLSLQLIAPTVADLVTIYRGSSCKIF